MKSLIVALIIHFTLNIFVFWKGWNAFNHKKWAKILLIAIFGTEILVYTFTFFFHRILPDDWVHIVRYTGTTWMLFLLYTSGLLLISDFIYLLAHKQLRRPKQILYQPRKLKITLFLVIVTIVAEIMAYGGYRFKNPVVTQVDMQVNKSVANRKSLRVAVAGDLHLGYMTSRENARDYVDVIMAQQPDLILFVGDILDARIGPVLERGLDKELKRLHAPLGVFSCTGNHEYRFEGEEKIALLNSSGIRMLRDEAVLIDSAFYVVGREDVIVPDRLPLPEILSHQKVDMSKPVIVLNHNPSDLAQEADAKADIALYGHTHHGQAFPGNLATELIFEVAHGYKKKGDTHVYVTSGLGLVGPRYRIATVSEVVVLNVLFD